MKASQLCELREGFIREWQKDFPFVPPPALRGIDKVQESDVIDESEASGHIATLWGSVQAVNNKLDQLDEQIRRKQRVKDFLINLLKTFDSEFDEKASNHLSKPSDRSNNNIIGSTTTVLSGSNGSTIVTVTSGERCVTPCRDTGYPNKRSVLCVPTECAAPATVCNHSSSSLSVARNAVNTCEKACSADFTSFRSPDKVDIGIQCDLKRFNGNVFSAGSFIGYKSVIHHKAGRECHDRCVAVNGSVTESSQNTEVCESGEDNGHGCVDEEKFYYDNNWVLKEHSGDMFGKRKKGSTSGRGVEEGGSLRGGKDNFLAVTSQRKLHQEEESSTSNQSNRDVSGGGGGGSHGSSPSLTRNFQLLKLTSGFDLVLDDSDSNCSTDDQSGIFDHCDKTKSGKTNRSDSLSQIHSDKKVEGLKPEETLFITSENDSSINTDSNRGGDNSDDDDTTPTCEDFKSLKFDYDSGDISKALDRNPPDLVSSTLSTSTMISSQAKQGSHGDDNTPTTHLPSRSDVKRHSGGPPPPVARKPSRPSTGKKLPSIPVGVEPVTRPIPSKRTQQPDHDNNTVTSDPVPIQHVQNQRQSHSITTTTDNARASSHISTTQSNNTNPPPNLTSPKEIAFSKDPSKPDDNNYNTNDTSSLRSSSPSSSSFLSSSPDFRASLTAGIIPATPSAGVAIGQSNPKRQSNFYYDIDGTSLDPRRDSTGGRRRHSSGSDSDTDDDDALDKARKGGLNDLVHGTNSTMIFISQADPSLFRSVSSSTQNDENDGTSGNSNSGATDDGTKQLPGNASEQCTSNNNPQLSQSSPPSSSTPTSPPPPPLPKRESRRASSSSSGVVGSVGGNRPFSYDARGVVVEEMNNSNNNNNNNTIEVADDDGSAFDNKYSRMASTDTLVDEDQQHAREKRRSESFTSDIDVKDAISAFDQIISAQCPDLAEESEDNNNNNTMETHRRIRSRRRSSSVINYENWTINRALTASISSRCRSESLNLEEFNFTDYGDAADNDGTTINDDDSSNASMPSPDLPRPGYISHGSKDSGLCDDMSVSDSMHSELELAGGRISDLRQIQEMERWEEEEATGMIDGIRSENATVTVTPCEYVTDYDSVSLTSDIVFLSGSVAKKRQSRAFLEDDKNGGDEEEEEEEGGGGGGGEDDDDDIVDGRDGRLDTISTASSLDDGDGRSPMNTSYEENESGREGMLKMRQLLIKGVLDSEKLFLAILGQLIHYKKLMEASSRTSQPVISDSDIQGIFGNIEKLHEIHTTFVTSLEAKVKAWTHAECVGEIFKMFVLDFAEFSIYVNNYSNAVSIIHKCGQESERFQQIATEIVVKSTNVRESLKLEDALFKPVQRVQRNSLVLHDLIKYTPEDHPDNETLKKALKLSQHNLESFEATMPHANTNPENRRLVKTSFLVELVNGVRKLRYMFLFSDILICTKRETHRNNKVTFQIKWFAPLTHMTYDTKFAYKDDTKFSKKDDIHELKNKIKGLKREMKAEMKKFDDKDKHRSIVNIGGAARSVEKLRKKILQYEGQLILASPKLPFKVSLEGGKVYTLLMTTDYEKEEWKEAFNTLCKRNAQRDTQQPSFNSIIVQELIDSVKETPQVNKIGNVLLQKDEEILTGTLNITIHKMNGLTQECDTYCCLEMDSFGHFFMMARTKMCEASRDPNWNEDFELELEGSMTLRILCFMKAEGGDGDQLLGRGALELDKHWLKGSFQEKTISMNEISLVVSVRHTPAEKTMQRTPSRTRLAVFGVEISSCARREGKTVPTIITACIKEVEKRGLEEVGIYRVSGVTSDLQRIKKLFDRNISVGASSLEDIDINAVTGSLKLYLRELPEPLFTEAAYQKFVGTLKLSDDEAKSQCILSLLHELPDTNYYTIVCLLEHLVKVARYVGENRMSIHNLSTIFGPTLLAPATKTDVDKDPLAMMWQGAEQVMQQSGVVSYLLGLAVSGRSLRRSSS